MRPTSWGSARNRRARTVVEALEAPALVPLVTSPRPRCCPVRSQARQGVNWIGRSSHQGRPQFGHLARTAAVHSRSVRAPM